MANLDDMFEKNVSLIKLQTVHSEVIKKFKMGFLGYKDYCLISDRIVSRIVKERDGSINFEPVETERRGQNGKF